jgi:hypothetical protein
VDYLSGDHRSQDGTDDPSVQKVVEHFAQFGVPYAKQFLAAVPEPAAAVTLILLGSAAIVRRRRQRRSDHR